MALRKLTVDELECVATFLDGRSGNRLRVAVASSTVDPIWVAEVNNMLLFRARNTARWDVRRHEGRLTVDFAKQLKQVRKLLNDIKKKKSEEEAKAMAAALRRVIKSAFPHGALLWEAKPHYCAMEAEEMVSVISIDGADESKVVFVISMSNQNACDRGCWCTSAVHYIVDVILPTKEEPIQLLLFGFLGGEGYGFGHTFCAPEQPVVDDVAQALGINPKALGIVLQALIILGAKGDYAWETLEELAGCKRSFWDEDKEVPSFARTYPDSKASKTAPDALKNCVVGNNPEEVHSPRKLRAMLLPALAQHFRHHPGLVFPDVLTLHRALRGWDTLVTDPEPDRDEFEDY